MIGKVQVTTRPPLFELKGKPPQKIVVCDTAPIDSKTRTYSVVADYGWAERILCSGCYLDDANAIAEVIAEYCLIPFKEAPAML